MFEAPSPHPSPQRGGGIVIAGNIGQLLAFGVVKKRGFFIVDPSLKSRL